MEQLSKCSVLPKAQRRTYPQQLLTLWHQPSQQDLEGSLAANSKVLSLLTSSLRKALSCIYCGFACLGSVAEYCVQEEMPYVCASQLYLGQT